MEARGDLDGSIHALEQGLSLAIPGALFPTDVEIEFAKIYNNLSNRLSKIGKTEAALDAATTAVKIASEISTKNDYDGRELLAYCENTLAGRYMEALDADSAIVHLQRSVDLRFELSEDHEDLHGPYYCISLINLASVMLSLGQVDRAESIAEKSCNISARLYEARPAAFWEHFARSRMIFGIVKADLGDIDVAHLSFHGAIFALLDEFSQNPESNSDLMMELLDCYFDACREGNKAIDEPLIERVVQESSPINEDTSTSQKILDHIGQIQSALNLAQR